MVRKLIAVESKPMIHVSRCALRIMLLCLASEMVCLGQGGSKSNLPFPRFNQFSGEVDVDGVPSTGAKLCIVGHKDACYQLPAHPASGSKEVVYQFGLDPKSERLPLSDGGSWVFFSGTFSAGGSGSLERLAILRYEANGGIGKIVNLLPFVSASNVSERAMWNVPDASGYPILVHADFVWKEGEAHFGRHYYNVEAWLFDPQLERYSKGFTYQTGQRYDGGDAAPVRVLSSEREEVLRRLGKHVR